MGWKNEDPYKAHNGRINPVRAFGAIRKQDTRKCRKHPKGYHCHGRAEVPVTRESNSQRTA